MYKTTFKATLIALATAASFSSAFAVDEVTFVNNTQINLNDVFSTINTTIDEIKESTKIKSSAIGNNFVLSATDVGPINVATSQTNNADNIISHVTLDVLTTPTVDITSEAIANKTIIIAKGTGGNTISNMQNAGAALPPPAPTPAPGPIARPDPLSQMDITLGTLTDLDLKSTAGGNMAQFVLEGTGNAIESEQTNSVINTSLVNVSAVSLDGLLDIDSKAFGNSLVIVLGDIEEPDTE